MYKPAALLIAIALLLVSCSASPSGSNDILRLGLTPNLAFLQGQIYTCSAGLPGHVQVEVSPADTLTYGKYTAIIHAGNTPRDTVFSTQVASLNLYVILNPGNPISTLERGDLAQILLGIESDWQALYPQSFPKPTPIHVWSYPPGDDIRAIVQDSLLDERLITAASYLAPDSQAMLAAVLNDPAAIGYLVEDGGQAENNRPAADAIIAYTLQAPVLASFGATPEGTIKELIFCLSKSGK